MAKGTPALDFSFDEERDTKVDFSRLNVSLDSIEALSKIGLISKPTKILYSAGPSHVIGLEEARLIKAFPDLNLPSTIARLGNWNGKDFKKAEAEDRIFQAVRNNGATLPVITMSSSAVGRALRKHFFLPGVPRKTYIIEREPTIFREIQNIILELSLDSSVKVVLGNFEEALFTIKDSFGFVDYDAMGPVCLHREPLFDLVSQNKLKKGAAIRLTSLNRGPFAGKSNETIDAFEKHLRQNYTLVRRLYSGSECTLRTPYNYIVFGVGTKK